MAKEAIQLVAFNRGLISPLALARVDFKRAAFSAQVMDNWMARSLGSMMLRPGTGFIQHTNGDAAARFLSFIFRTDDTALIEFTNAVMRVWVGDAVVTRATVSSVVTNGDFTASVASWTNNDEAGATSDWVAATAPAAGGYLRLLGNGSAAAIRDQQVTVNGDSINVEHGLHIVIERGPVTLRVGSTSGGTDYLNDIVLRTGVHSLAFTPTGSAFFIRFTSTLDRYTLVDSCNVEAAGAMTIASPYLTADLGNIRGGDQSQSGDIIFVGCRPYQQRRIERHSTRSWSLVLYQANDGPFGNLNASATTITPNAISGNITLTASAPLFTALQVGKLYELTSNGQVVTATAVAQNTFTGAIRVTGVGAGRVFSINATGVTAGGSTVTLQRSLESSAGPWTDVTSYLTDQAITYNDTLDNQIAWYRLGVKTGGYVGGAQVMTLTYTNGSITGVVRIIGYTSNLVVTAEVLTHLGGTSATDQWTKGEWGADTGWPSAVGFAETRLIWAGNDGVWLSATDGFDSYADHNEDGSAIGDSGAIARTIGFGPVDIINWVLPLDSVILGGQSAEFTCRTSTFEEPLTPTNINIKARTNQGSAPVQPVKVDNQGAFVQRGGRRLYELAKGQDGYSYGANDLTLFIPEICGERGSNTYITRMAVQRQPDTRIHCIRSDGVAAILIYDKAENILCWLTASTPGGSFEDVVVLPSQLGQDEDSVYYVVKRTIGGATVRHLEKWATEAGCQGGTLNRQMDAFIEFTNSPPSLIVSVPHLIGQTVVCWHDGICELDANLVPKTYVVGADGNITLDTVGTTGVVGLAYNGDWQSNFLGHNLPAVKTIINMGCMLKNTHPRGLRFGSELSDVAGRMDYLPLVAAGKPVDTSVVYSNFDSEPIPFPGNWETDARLCLRAQSPLPVTVLAATVLGRGNV